MPSSPRAERLGALDEARLGVARRLVLFVEPGIELATVLVEGGARIAESLPQLLAGALGQAGPVAW
jgi:hypothetical protein